MGDAEPQCCLRKCRHQPLAAAGEIVAGAAIDWEGAACLVHFGPILHPNPANTAAYANGCRQFRDLYRRLAPWFAAN